SRASRSRTRVRGGDVVRSLSTPALVIVVAQESLERSVQLGHPAVVSMTPTGWLVLVVGILATALILALALRAGQVFLSFVTRGSTRRARVAVSRVTSR